MLGLPEGRGALFPLDVLIGVFEECLAGVGVDDGRLLVLFRGDDDRFLGLQFDNFPGIGDVGLDDLGIVGI